jgi:hypothetical protein
MCKLPELMRSVVIDAWHGRLPAWEYVLVVALAIVAAVATADSAQPRRPEPGSGCVGKPAGKDQVRRALDSLGSDRTGNPASSNSNAMLRDEGSSE